MKNTLIINLTRIWIPAVILQACNPKDAHEHHASVSQAVTPTAGLMLSDSQVRLANITTKPARIQEVGQSIWVNARLTANEERTEKVSSRVEGRVEKLLVRETGRNLRAGELLMEIYSETLLTYQREYLLMLDQAGELGQTDARYSRFVQSARKKLLRYGLSDAQVDELSRSRNLTERVSFYAPAGGVVTSLLVTEGQYVEEGTPLYQVEDIRRLWVEAELFPEEAGKVRLGQQVVVKIAGWEHNPLDVLVTFVAPEYTGNSQLTRMRATLDNPSLQYQPGMQAQVLWRPSVRQALALPVDAVIRGNRSSHIFVLSDQNTFERREVKTGLEDVDRVEILSGLREGEQVVVTGAYLLHSEMILKGIGN